MAFGATVSVIETSAGSSAGSSSGASGSSTVTSAVSSAMDTSASSSPLLFLAFLAFLAFLSSVASSALRVFFFSPCRATASSELGTASALFTVLTSAFEIFSAFSASSESPRLGYWSASFAASFGLACVKRNACTAFTASYISRGTYQKTQPRSRSLRSCLISPSSLGTQLFFGGNLHILPHDPCFRERSEMDTSGSQLPPEQQGRSRRKWREKHINNAYETQKVRLRDLPSLAPSAERWCGPSLAQQACSWRTTSSRDSSTCIY